MTNNVFVKGALGADDAAGMADDIVGTLDDTLDDAARAAARSIDDVLDDAAHNIGEVIKVLWENKRLDLSVEALILKQEYQALFSDDERKQCQERLLVCILCLKTKPYRPIFVFA